MVFYKGSMQYETLIGLPYPELLKFDEVARKINEDQERAAKKRGL